MKKFILTFLCLLFYVSIASAADVQLTWDDSNPNGTVQSFTIYWYETSVPDIKWNKTTNGYITNLILTIDYFKPNTKYSFYAIANGQSVSPGSSVVMMSDPSETLTDIPRVITGDVIPQDKLPDPVIIQIPVASTMTITIAPVVPVTP